MHSLALSPTILWLILCSASLIIFFFIFFPDRLHELHVHWTTAGDLDMGYPLLAITAFFCFKASRNIKQLSPNYAFLPLILALSVLLFISSILDIKTLFFVGLCLSFPLFMYSVLGIKATQRLLLPLLITFMAMPFWYLAISILQKITVLVVTFFAEMLQLTVLIEGNYFTIPTGVVHVAGGCSGLKYFLSGLTISLISSAFSNRTLKLTFISIIAAGLLAIIGNWIRVFALLLIGYYEGISHPLMADHDTLGWFVFAGVMLPWFFLDNKLEKSTKKNTPDKPQENLPVKSDHTKLITVFTLSLALLLAPALLLNSDQEIDFTTKKLDLSHTLAGFTLNERTKASHALNYPAAELSFNGQYVSDNQKLEIQVLTYNLQGETEMANTTNTIFEPDAWHLIADKAYQDPNNLELRIRVAIGRQGSYKRMVYYWYKHDTTMANSILKSKVAQLYSLLGGDSIGHLVAIIRNCSFDCAHPDSLEPELVKLIEALQQNIRISEATNKGTSP